MHPDFAPVANLLRRQLGRRPGSGAAICIFHRGECVADIWGGVRDARGNEFGLVEDIRYDNGMVHAPTKPGLGYEIDWELVRREHTACVE